MATLMRCPAVGSQLDHLDEAIDGISADEAGLLCLPWVKCEEQRDGGVEQKAKGDQRGDKQGTAYPGAAVAPNLG